MIFNVWLDQNYIEHSEWNYKRDTDVGSLEYDETVNSFQLLCFSIYRY